MLQRKTIEILDHLIKKHKIDNIYSNKIFKGKYFNNLDRDINSFLMERGVIWHQKNQFGIQLDKRVRGNGLWIGTSLLLIQ